MRFAPILALLGLVLSGSALAQEPAAPGAFDCYLLALTWSPSFCADHRGDPSARDECALRRGLVVHGLWPQDEDGSWPAFCRPVGAVPANLAKLAASALPSYGLMDHEWRKHGSCTTMQVEDYFGTIAGLFGDLRLPEPLAHPERDTTLSLGETKRLLAAANNGLTADAISLQCDGGNRVHELRLCLDKSLHFRRCGDGQADTCPATLDFPAGAD